MSDLNDTYRQLATTWTQAELEARYRDAEHRGVDSDEDTADGSAKAVSLVAAAIPPASATSVAIHILHVLPNTAPDDLLQQLLATGTRNMDQHP